MVISVTQEDIDTCDMNSVCDCMVGKVLRRADPESDWKVAISFVDTAAGRKAGQVYRLPPHVAEAIYDMANGIKVQPFSFNLGDLKLKPY